MRNRSAANNAASSPPVPARTSRMALFSSAVSLGSNCTFSFFSNSSIFGPRPSNSSSASAAMSLSEAGSSTSCCRSRRSPIALRNAVIVATIGSSSANSRDRRTKVSWSAPEASVPCTVCQRATSLSSFRAGIVVMIDLVGGLEARRPRSRLGSAADRPCGYAGRRDRAAWRGAPRVSPSSTPMRRSTS